MSGRASSCRDGNLLISGRSSTSDRFEGPKFHCTQCALVCAMGTYSPSRVHQKFSRPTFYQPAFSGSPLPAVKEATTLLSLTPSLHQLFLATLIHNIISSRSPSGGSPVKRVWSPHRASRPIWPILGQVIWRCALSLFCHYHHAVCLPFYTAKLNIFGGMFSFKKC